MNGARRAAAAVLLGALAGCASDAPLLYSLSPWQAGDCPAGAECRLCPGGQDCGWYRPAADRWANAGESLAALDACIDELPDDVVLKAAGRLDSEPVRTTNCDLLSNPLACDTSGTTGGGQRQVRRCDVDCLAARTQSDEAIDACMRSAGWDRMIGRDKRVVR